MKAPLALGVAAGGLLLAQAFVVTPHADACTNQHDCPESHQCSGARLEWENPDGDRSPTYIQEGSACVPDG